MLRLGERGYLLAAGQATAQAHIRTDVGAALVLQELLKLKDCSKPLASGNGDVTALLHITHACWRVRKHGILVEKRGELLQSAPQGNRFCRIHLPVDFDADVYVRAYSLSHCADPSHGLRRPFGIRLVEVEIRAPGREAHRREPLPRFRHRVLHQLVEGVTAYVDIATDFLARLPTHEIVDRHTQTLSLDVPQGNIDRREGALEHGTHEVG